MMQQVASISWEGHRPEIRTERFVMRPVCAKDLPRYQELFANAVAMKHHTRNTRTPAETAARFQGWLERWKVHPFSALAIYRTAVVDKSASGEEFVGHAELGHGEYEGDPKHGFSEAVIILTPEYWNAGFAAPQHNEQIGKAGMEGVGTEISTVLLELLPNEMAEKKFEVPVDVTDKHQEEVEKHLARRTITNCMRDPATQKIKAVFVPFTEVRVTCSMQNRAMVKLLHTFIERLHGRVEGIKGDPPRQLVKFSLETSGK